MSSFAPKLDMEKIKNLLLAGVGDKKALSEEELEEFYGKVCEKIFETRKDLNFEVSS